MTTTLDTRLAAYSGACGNLTLIACNDDACALQSRISFSVQGGATYVIRAAGFSGGSGTFSINAANGPFANTTATTSTPQACCFATRDIWFRFTAPCEAEFRFETCRSSFDTVIELFAGSCGSGYVNDECSTAIPILIGDNGPFSTVGSTGSLPAMTCGGL